MIPNISGVTFDLEINQPYNLTYNLTNDRLGGTVDDLEALKQAILIMLSIERYDYVIYPWQYGLETKDLIGQPMYYVKSVIKDRIRECLLTDDRINDVTDFVVTSNKNNLSVTFTVKSIYGEMKEDLEVAI